MSESCSDNCQTCGKTCAERREPQSISRAESWDEHQERDRRGERQGRRW